LWIDAGNLFDIDHPWEWCPGTGKSIRSACSLGIKLDDLYQLYIVDSTNQMPSFSRRMVGYTFISPFEKGFVIS
jgi:hypothetical protein